MLQKDNLTLGEINQTLGEHTVSQHTYLRFIESHFKTQLHSKKVQ